jgi:hypothetical protein
MTTQQITFLLAPYGTATLSLPERLTPDAFLRLNSAIGQALREPRAAAGCAAAEAATDPGAIEVDSWLVQGH